MSAPILNSSLLRSRLKLKHIQSDNLLRSHHSEAVAMLEAGGVKPGNLRSHATKLLTAGAAAASFMLSPLQSGSTQAALPDSSHRLFVSPTDYRSALSQALKLELPDQVRPLLPQEETIISQSIHDILGIHAYAELEGNHLNTSYGLIGQEQHLPRFPADTIGQHDTLLEHGITPGRGAWGYFASSKDRLTPEKVTMEKYYVAVQTLYLPDWSTRLAYLRDWYKFRKVIVINPHNGRAVVAVIADSGPAAWTGKHFGGSPEVMEYLRRQDGRARGPVILFFVDDPENTVPLGPVEYNLEQGPALLSAQ
jgi:hypothetical protein